MLIFSIVTAIFITVYLVFYSLLSYIYRDKKRVSSRLESISKQDTQDEHSELNQPLFIRVVKPALDSISKVILKVTPKEITSILEKKVIMSGKPYNLSVKDWINIQVVLVLGLPILTVLICSYNNTPLKNILLVVLLEIAAGLILPNFILSKKVTHRHKLIQNSLPDVLDLLTVSVEAGLGFDGALIKVVDKMPGPLATEFENVLQEMKVGRQKKDALKDMAERLGVADLTTFIGSVIQAEQLGVSMGNVLRLQSEQMRQKRRQRAQEKAMKAPVKMLIPMVAFIFPTIFSVLIGPAIIKVIDMFMK